MQKLHERGVSKYVGVTGKNGQVGGLHSLFIIMYQLF